MPTSRQVLALDIGGTRLAAAAVDEGGRILRAGSIATPHPAEDDPEVLWRALVGLTASIATDLAPTGPGPSGPAGEDGLGEPVNGSRAEHIFSGVGVGCGGPMVWPEGVVSPLNIPSWRAFPLRARLRELYPGMPVRVHNTAVCVTVGEHWRGAGRGLDHVLGMVLSSGIGGGLISGGRLLHGRTGNAGHIGHVVIDPVGPECHCGGRGCLEAIAPAPRLIEWAQEQGWRPGPDPTARDLTDDASRGHPVALAALQRSGEALGVAVASITSLCDLETVAISGGLSQAGPLLFDPLEAAFRRHARLEYATHVRVVPAALGQEAGLVGAAALLLGSGDRYWTVD